MNLFRFVHENVAHLVRDEPLRGCVAYNGSPYFYGFIRTDSAIIESPIWHALDEVPRTLLAVEYAFPDESIYAVKDKPVFGDYTRGNHHLGKWVDDFLKKKTALLAVFPSKHWAWAKVENYIVNPRHDLFRQVKIVDFHRIYRM